MTSSVFIQRFIFMSPIKLHTLLEGEEANLILISFIFKPPVKLVLLPTYEQAEERLITLKCIF